MGLAYEALAPIIYPEARKLFSDGIEKMYVIAEIFKKYSIKYDLPSNTVNSAMIAFIVDCVEEENKNKNFSKWVRFNDRKILTKYYWKFPGIYAIAYSENNISELDFSYISEIVYFGMTNSKNGLKGRLDQFESTINDKHKTHGGAERFVFSLSKEDKLWKDKLYVSIKSFNGCNVNSNDPKDLMIMGEVERQEYICFANYVQEFNRLPRFNNKKESPKK